MNSTVLSAVALIPKSVALPLFIILPVLFVALLVVFYFYLVWALRLFRKTGRKQERLWSPTDQFDISRDVKTVRKDPSKDFVILTLADIQVHDRFRLNKNRVIYQTIAGAIKQAQPDMIVLLGDNCWGYARQCYRRLVSIMDSFGIPWAPVFGNHDMEGNADLELLADILSTGKRCLFTKGPRSVTGIGNYAVNVVQEDKIVHTLFMFDTGDWQIDYDPSKIVYLKADENMKEKMPAFYVEAVKDGPHKGEVMVGTSCGWGTLSYEQIDYYKWLLAGITKANGGITPESSMYMHIPLYEYNAGYFEWVDGGCDPEKGFGEINEQICSPALSTGMFDAILQAGSTKNVVVGHDHENNLSVLYKGVRLSYGMKCADECSWREYTSGGSTVTVDKNGKGTFAHVYVKPTGLRHKEGILGKIFY